jgi:hypothetical protein
LVIETDERRIFGFPLGMGGWSRRCSPAGAQRDEVVVSVLGIASAGEQTLGLQLYRRGLPEVAMTRP